MTPPIEYHETDPTERARLYRNQRRVLEQQIAVIEAEQAAGIEIDTAKLEDLEQRHGSITTTINQLEGEAAS